MENGNKRVEQYQSSNRLAKNARRYVIQKDANHQSDYELEFRRQIESRRPNSILDAMKMETRYVTPHKNDTIHVTLESGCPNQVCRIATKKKKFLSTPHRIFKYVQDQVKRKLRPDKFVSKKLSFQVI